MHEYINIKKNNNKKSEKRKENWRKCKFKVFIRQNFVISMKKHMITEKERNGNPKNTEIKN
jgi:hypothetical protein